MKLEARRIEAFLKSPGAVRAVLLHGEDDGLIRERAASLVISVAERLDDPFRVTELLRESHGQIVSEVIALSLSGGRRAVRVREAGDAICPGLQRALSGPGEALLIIEAGPLAPKSKLRRLAEQRQDIVSIACYREEGERLEHSIRSILSGHRVTIDREALNFLTSQLGDDRAATRQEVEKLALCVGVGGHVDLRSANEVVGDVASLQLDDALFAATEGDVEGTDRALDLALAEGATPVAILRTALTHLQRLQRGRAMIDEGASLSDAVQNVRPPVFFRRQDSFATALRIWSGASLAAACVYISETERECKRTGSPDELLCRGATTMMARRTRSRR